jgi:hypothetical protein
MVFRHWDCAYAGKSTGIVTISTVFHAQDVDSHNWPWAAFLRLGRRPVAPEAVLAVSGQFWRGK